MISTRQMILLMAVFIIFLPILSLALELQSSPAVYGDKLYVVEDKKVSCKSASNLEKIWEFVTGNEVKSSPAVSDGKVYVGSWDTKVYCLDANTGQKIWDFMTDMGVDSSPAVSDGKVYVGSDKVYCLDANTGQKIWDFKTVWSVDSSPAVSGGKVYVGSVDRKVYCLDANTGQKIWEFMIGDWVLSSPAVSAGKVYVGSDDKKVYCLDANTGQKIWEFMTGGWVKSSPAVSAGKVYVGSNDGKVYCLGKNTGQKIWDFTTGKSVVSSPAVSGDKVYVGSDDGWIYVLDANTGQKINGVPLGILTKERRLFPVSSSLAISRGKVYVEEDGNTFILRFPVLKIGPLDPPWPMFRHDPQHTGDTSTPLEEIPVPILRVIPTNVKSSAPFDLFIEAIIPTGVNRVISDTILFKGIDLNTPLLPSLSFDSFGVKGSLFIPNVMLTSASNGIFEWIVTTTSGADSVWFMVDIK